MFLLVYADECIENRQNSEIYVYQFYTSLKFVKKAFMIGAIHKRRRNILRGGGGGSQIPILQDVR